MKPNNSVLDHGNKNHAEKWTCQAPEEPEKLPVDKDEEVTLPSENRIPKDFVKNFQFKFFALQGSYRF